MASPAHVSCDECRTLNRENGEEPDCIRCDRPRTVSRRGMVAFTTWGRLDSNARPWDTMAGAPLPLPLSEVRAECGRTEDPDAYARLVMAIEGEVHKARLEAFRREQEQKKK